MLNKETSLATGKSKLSLLFTGFGQNVGGFLNSDNPNNTSILTVAVLLSVVPSLALKVKLSGPFYLPSGV